MTITFKPTRQRRSLSVMAGLIGAGAILALSACGDNNAQQGPAPGPAEVGVVTVRTEPVSLTTELAGRTSAFLVSDVRPQVGGLIKTRQFTEGAYVEAGQSLYQIDSAPYEAARAAAQAQVAQADATLAAAKLKADRYAELVKVNAISKQENDDAQAALKQAEATLAAAKANLQTAAINVGYTRVQAPISGRIGKSNVTPGALVTASQATELTRIQNLSSIYLDINQSVSEVLALRKAVSSGELDRAGTAEVELILEDGSVYPVKGRLQFSDVSVDESTGTVTLRALFPNPNGELLPGMYARARLTSGVVGNGILVPQPAVTRDPKGNALVYVVTNENKVAARPIQVRQTVGDKWLVTGGLRAGERVIVEGLQKVQPDAEVKATPAGQAQKPAAAQGQPGAAPANQGENASASPQAR